MLLAPPTIANVFDEHGTQTVGMGIESGPMTLDKLAHAGATHRCIDSAKHGSWSQVCSDCHLCPFWRYILSLAYDQLLSPEESSLASSPIVSRHTVYYFRVIIPAWVHLLTSSLLKTWIKNVTIPYGSLQSHLEDKARLLEYSGMYHTLLYR